MKHATYALWLVLLGTSVYATDVYRTTAPDGTVSYSDRPQGADSQLVLATQGAPRAQPGAARPGHARRCRQRRAGPAA